MADKKQLWADAPVRTLRRGQFWVPGERVALNGKTYQRGPMFVEWETPERVTRHLPIVLVHGGTFRERSGWKLPMVGPAGRSDWWKQDMRCSL